MFRRILFPVFVLLLPPAAFVGGMYWAVAGLSAGGGTGAFVLQLVGGLAVMALLEVVLLRSWVLPAWSQSIGERLYAGSYTPAQDAVVALADEVRKTGDAALLPALGRLVRADPSRLRGWRELADVQLNIFKRPEDAFQTLVEAAGRVGDKEERAMLLYRAAHMAESLPGRADEAQRLYSTAASRYPRTVYGRKAAEKAED